MEKGFVGPAANAALKQKWVEALRSGAYRQTQGYLHKDGAYCCLGVLCKIAGADMDGDFPAYIDEETYTEQEELGWRLRQHFHICDLAESTLINLNDQGNRPFSVIADWIETHNLETGEVLLQAERSDAAPTPLSE